MATVVPPPSKRQKTAVAEKSREQQSVEDIPSGLGSIRVQFNDQSTGQSIGAPISIPVVDTTVKNLELLLNTIQRNVGPIFLNSLNQAKGIWPSIHSASTLSSAIINFCQCLLFLHPLAPYVSSKNEIVSLYPWHP